MHIDAEVYVSRCLPSKATVPVEVPVSAGQAQLEVKRLLLPIGLAQGCAKTTLLRSASIKSSICSEPLAESARQSVFIEGGHILSWDLRVAFTAS